LTTHDILLIDCRIEKAASLDLAWVRSTTQESRRPCQWPSNRKACLEFLDAKYGREQAHNEHLNNLRARLQIDLTLFNQELGGIGEARESSFTNYQDIYLELLEQQRRLLNEMNRLAEFDEELIRKYLSLIDVEEFKFREKRIQVAAPITCTESNRRSLPPKPGKLSFPIMTGTSLASIFLLSLLRPSVTFTASSSFCIKDVKSFISTSRNTRPPPGRTSS